MSLPSPEREAINDLLEVAMRRELPSIEVPQIAIHEDENESWSWLKLVGVSRPGWADSFRTESHRSANVLVFKHTDQREPVVIPSTEKHPARDDEVYKAAVVIEPPKGETISAVGHSLMLLAQDQEEYRVFKETGISRNVVDIIGNFIKRREDVVI